MALILNLPNPIEVCKTAQLQGDFRFIVLDFIDESEQSLNLSEDIALQIHSTLEMSDELDCVETELVDESDLDTLISDYMIHLILFGRIVDEDKGDEWFEICPEFYSEKSYSYMDPILNHPNMTSCFEVNAGTLNLSEMAERISIIDTVFKAMTHLENAEYENVTTGYSEAYSLLIGLTFNETDPTIDNSIFHLLAAEVVTIINNCEFALSAYDSILPEHRDTRWYAGKGRVILLCINAHHSDDTIIDYQFTDAARQNMVLQCNDNIVPADFTEITSIPQMFRLSEQCLDEGLGVLKTGQVVDEALLHFYRSFNYFLLSAWEVSEEWELVYDEADKAIQIYENANLREQKALDALEIFRVWGFQAESLIEQNCENIDEAKEKYEKSILILKEHPNRIFQKIRTEQARLSIEKLESKVCS